MSRRDITLAVFIDYDNLLPVHKDAGILDVVTKVLNKIPLDDAIVRAKCDVRVYGGWYEGTQITRLAQDVTVAIQNEFPSVIRFKTPEYAGVSIIVNAELAVALLEEPGHHLFNTYRRKGKPANVRVEEPAVVGCADAACILPLTKNLLKTGTCPRPGCSVVVSDLVYRQEQKIVDTMLSCDLIYAASAPYDRVILVSGDDDFLPPLRTILLRGVAVVRFHPKQNYQRAVFPRGDFQLLELDL